MRCAFADRNENYRWPDWVRVELLYAIAHGDEKRFKKILEEYFKWGSTERDAYLMRIPARSLRRLCHPCGNVSAKILFKIFSSLNSDCKTKLEIRQPSARLRSHEGVNGLRALMTAGEECSNSLLSGDKPNHACSGHIWPEVPQAGSGPVPADAGSGHMWPEVPQGDSFAEQPTFSSQPNTSKEAAQ